MYAPGIVQIYDQPSKAIIVQPFVIRPICTRLWNSSTLLSLTTADPAHLASLLRLSDVALLKESSTSPYAEDADFVARMREVFAIAYRGQRASDTFPGGRPRVYVRSAEGTWVSG